LTVDKQCFLTKEQLKSIEELLPSKLLKLELQEFYFKTERYHYGNLTKSSFLMTTNFRCE